jgi:hypothetical protein
MTYNEAYNSAKQKLWQSYDGPVPHYAFEREIMAIMGEKEYYKHYFRHYWKQRRATNSPAMYSDVMRTMLSHMKAA